ncbi:MAG: rRNA maturation RNase YbeY [Flavobacteriales bacterium]|nr:rRNA maturation RNase YbeY [Flavobacteriales bacterium]|tara:strand:- start:2870 stop:3322 length:453 start_codon:yes stop_codon:yes gene_type:complete
MKSRSPIHFHSEEVDFSLSNQEEHISWIQNVIDQESKKVGELNFIFCSDDYLLTINQEYLKHDYYTDIITFNYNEEDAISGDIFISIDRITENAKERAIPFEIELERVMIHGVLHLIGYDDKEPESQATMRAKEDFCLTLHPLRNKDSST